MNQLSEITEFREGVRAWLEKNCPPEMRIPIRNDSEICWGGRNFKFVSEAQKLWLQRMATQGWTVPTWPKEFGGGGLSNFEAKALIEEMESLGCRVPLSNFGIHMLGPTLLKFGTLEQKLEHLPPIARGEIRWCQGYSEPNAGSDLASLSTSAVVQGEHLIVNGQKIWTSYANESDWTFCLVRTDTSKKQSGISFVLFDMQSPGVKTKPIRLISGNSPFCETFFENVKVDLKNLVGSYNGGWEVAKYLLAQERDMIGSVAETTSSPSVSALAKSALGLDALGRLSDPLLRSDIALFESDEAAYRLTLQRLGELSAKKQASPAMSSVLKYYGAELNKRRWELIVSCHGSDALEMESKRSSRGVIPRTWLRTKANSIEGGTNEVQLNVISKRILDLPGV